MRLGTKLGLLLTALACAAGAFATPATAAGAEEDEGAFAAFVLQGTHGYRFSAIAFAESHANGKGFVLLWAIRKGSNSRSGSSVEYDFPAKVTTTLPPLGEPALSASIATSIHANLGDLGRIAVEFKPSGAEETYRSPCFQKTTTTTTTYPAGSYEGTVEFHGEEGFTRAGATQTSLSLQPVAILDCAEDDVVEEEQGPVFPGAALRVTAGTRGRTLQFHAIQNRRGARVRLNATLTERHDGIRIAREVTEMAAASAFSFDPRLRTASLAPPDPFSGAASFRRDAARANRLKGNLSIDFPGKSGVPAAGPGVRAQLVHAAFGKSVEDLFEAGRR